MTQKLKKGYYFTDIHFGKKSNSPIHNQDCIDYINWFCEQIKNDPEADYIAFLGDWHESRNAIDIATLMFSYKGAKIINDLGLPVYFIIGNHDMGSRHSREIYSTIPFHEFNNFKLIHEQPYVADEILGGALFVPFLIPEEYESLHDYKHIGMWAGHFEFQGFVLTGYSIRLEHGPSISPFKDVNNILSGHFHKRQQIGNTTYIGNTFPMDFGDNKDNDRGLAIYDHKNHNVSFINWDQCPRYIKCTLSQIVDNNIEITEKSNIHVDIDMKVTYQQLTSIEESIKKQFKPRSLHLDESSKFIIDNEVTEHNGTQFESVSTDDLIIQILKQTDVPQIDTNLLVDLYRNA